MDRSSVAPRLTVVIGSVESARSIEACLASIERACRGLEAEILLIDASTDDTAEIARARFPSVRVVVDHLNNPDPGRGLDQPAFRALLALARWPQVHVKLSGFHHWCGERYPYRDGMPFVEAAVRAFGADHLTAPAEVLFPRIEVAPRA